MSALVAPYSFFLTSLSVVDVDKVEATWLVRSSNPVRLRVLAVCCKLNVTQFPPLFDGTTGMVTEELPCVPWVSPAHEGFPSHMARLSWDAPRRGDIVLLECGFRRSSTVGLWLAEFTLRRVVIVCRAPRTDN